MRDAYYYWYADGQLLHSVNNDELSPKPSNFAGGYVCLTAAEGDIWRHYQDQSIYCKFIAVEQVPGDIKALHLLIS